MFGFKISDLFGGNRPPKKTFSEEQAESHLKIDAMSDDRLVKYIADISLFVKNKPPYGSVLILHHMRDEDNFDYALQVVKGKVEADGLAAHQPFAKIIEALATVAPSQQYNSQVLAKTIFDLTHKNEWAELMQPQVP